MKVLRIVPNMASEHFEASRDFYIAMFDLVVSVEQGSWYMQLMAPEDRSLNVGFLEPGHAFFAGRPSGPGSYAMVLTVQVDDVDDAYARAQQLDAEILMHLRDEEYGQRHFLVLDPNGLLLNVMSTI
jgi:predicted enzyme related to lactoylglutathione lyase